MRLIELDVAVQNTHKEIFWTESQRASMQNFLFHQPTIDPESLRPKGRWEERYMPNGEYVAWDGFYCSVCGKQAAKSNYCPNCGAKMEG